MARRRTVEVAPPPPPRWDASVLHALQIPLPKSTLDPATSREVGLIAVTSAIALYALALVDLSGPSGGGWLSVGVRHLVVPLIGFAGAWYLILPLVLMDYAILLGRPEEGEPGPSWIRGSAIYSLVLLVGAIAWGGVILQQGDFFLLDEDRFKVGWIGLTIGKGLMAMFGVRGAQVAVVGVAALCLPLTTGLSWPSLLRAIAERLQGMRVGWGTGEEGEDEESYAGEAAGLPEIEIRQHRMADLTTNVAVAAQSQEKARGKRRSPEPPADEARQAEVLADIAAQTAVAIERTVTIVDTNVAPDLENYDPDQFAFLHSAEQAELPFKPTKMELPYEFPSLRLLQEPPPRTINTENTDGVPEKVEKALEVLGIAARVDRITIGPSVTRVECIPQDGTRMGKIANMEQDLAYYLAAKSVRVEAPIPGKKAVGIELPNKVKELVTLQEILASEEYQSAKSVLTIGLGKDLTGKPIVADLTKMPHLLIAGQTGAGKSVCLNTIIMSLLYRAHPSLVKMILVDPKRVELTIYEGLPHLLVPVVQDVKKALNALHWAVMEMDDRYKVLQKARARTIADYNAKHRSEPMPYIVIIIDELADLMDVGASDIEKLINRLARLARAVGIHLVLATQRPDVKVITGQIKANIPTRIAFKVASIVDSKTILDYSGADKLLGFGDMLFKAIGESKPIRAQGCYVDEEEITGVCLHITRQLSPEYMEEIVADREEDLAKGVETGDEDLDGAGDDAEYWDEALQITLVEGRISASMLQRKLRIGYNRASRLVDIMEAKGIISGPNGARPREVIRADLYQSIEEL